VINFAFITSYDIPSLLGGLGLGMTFQICLNNCFMVGMNSTITTFASQLIGMGQIKRSGKYLNAARLITVGLAIPIMILLWFSEELLLAVGQDSLVAYHASRFCIGLIPSVVFNGWI
jgi:Na+-driven multidrug efflux pump